MGNGAIVQPGTLKEDMQEFYIQYKPRLLNSAYRFVRNREAAEDIVHDTFLATYTTSSTFDPAKGDNFYTWIHKILTNKCLSYLRGLRSKKARFVPLLEELRERGEDKNNLEKIIDSNDRVRWVKKESSKLSRKYREVLELIMNNFSNKEISDRLQMSGKVVKEYAYRIKKLLRSKFLKLEKF